MNHRQVAHVWAQQTKIKGKGHSLFFEGPTIYSYGRHFPIASFTKDARGKKCVLFTNKGYSVSTARHMSYTRYALRGLDLRIFNVERPDREPGREDADYLKKRAEECLIKAGRARVYKDSLLMSARRFEHEFFELCKAFKIKHPDARKKMLFPARDVKELQKAADIAAKMRAAETRRRNEERALLIAAARTEWLAGEKHFLSSEEASPVMLRIKGDVLQTSRGAEVPLAEARALYERAVRLGPGALAEEQPKIGEFRVNRMEGGDIVIGCHRVPYAEIVRVLGG